MIIPLRCPLCERWVPTRVERAWPYEVFCEECFPRPYAERKEWALEYYVRMEIAKEDDPPRVRR